MPLFYKGAKVASIFAALHEQLGRTLKAFVKNRIAGRCYLRITPALVLAHLGLLETKKATCYPALKHLLKHYVDERVVIDGAIVTSQGPGTAIEIFASAR